MGRFPKVATRLSVAGAVALVAGSMMLVGVAVQVITSPAFADTSPFELFCTNTPIGNLVFNDVVMTGTLSPATPSPGQQFSLSNFQTQVTVPADIVQAVTAVGNTSISGTASATVVASGATPTSMPTGSLAYDQTIPSPVPSSGLALDVPSTPATIGPFTATSSNLSLSLGSSITLTFSDVAFPSGLPPLECSAYPNDVMSSGLAQGIPPGLPISPVIAEAGQVSPPPPTSALTGPYELYCPHTPVGDLVFNGVTTTATISASSLSAGQQFQVSGYQTQIPLPSGLVSAAAGLNNSSFDGMAASAVDAYGATPDQVSTGSIAFDVPIPNPVPSAGLGLELPSSPITVGPFTASGGPITIAQDQSVFVVAALSSKAFTMSCTAYPNDSVANSGSTGTAPNVSPIRPIIAVASASGTSSTTTTTTAIPPTGPATSPPGTPYELYCPGSPVGNLVLNDTVTTGTISPSTLTEGDQFALSNLQTQFSIPQAAAQQAENLGLTQLSGDMSVFLNAQGVEGYGDGGGGGIGFATATATATSGTVPATTATTSAAGTPVTTLPPVSVPPEPIVPYPGPYGFGGLEMSFDVTLPNPVPAGGVQFDATPPPSTAGENSFVAAGGPIQLSIGEVNLNATEFGDNFGLFCTTFPNDSEPTGLSTHAPAVAPIEPVIATGQATIPPPAQGGEGPYELYCPGTPVGNIALNNATTTATLSPADPSAGSQFNVTGYQTTVDLPSSIVSAAAALGNSAISGTATTSLDASGATPASISTGTMSFDVPIPSPVPPSGLPLVIPSPSTTIGPFTASGGGIIVTQDATIQLSLEVSGSTLDLNCKAYPNNLEPTGIVMSSPVGPVTAPVIALGNGATLPPPTTTPTTTPTPVPPGSAGPYELYCPGTPVGNIALNDVTTTATISPADLTLGEEFNVTGYQTTVDLPSSIVSAAAALGNSAIVGSATATVDASGASPPSMSTGSLAIDAPIPSPVPASGLQLQLPSSPATIGPFSAAGGVVTIAEDANAQLTIDVSGSDLNLKCTAFPNDSDPTGIVSSPPSGSPASPVVATAQVTIPPPPTTSLPAGSPTTAGAVTVTTESPPTSPTTSATPTTVIPPAPSTSSTTSAMPTTPTSATTSSSAGTSATASTVQPATSDPTGSGSGGTQITAAPVVSASSGSLAFTGPGAAIRWIVAAGAALVVLGFAMLVLADVPTRLRWARAALKGAVRVGPFAASRGSRATRPCSQEVLWVDDPGHRDEPKLQR